MLSFLLIAALADPNAAISLARERLAAGDCRAAIETLRPVADERGAEAGAVHFYAALAYSDCNQPEEAKEELRQFFQFRPELTTIDAAKFPKRFVTLFKDVQRSVQSVLLFDRVYPGFDRYAEVPPEQAPMSLWGTHPGFQILAGADEKEAWGHLHTDEERARFIEDFWRLRDRKAINRRVAFADRTFSSPDEVRGALTDRGRVFVLLGPPARVYRTGLHRYETTIVQQRNRTPLTGSLERWVYFNWQLPRGIAAKEVEFRFITQPGYGDGVMQKDFWPLKALAEARKIHPSGAE